MNNAIKRRNMFVQVILMIVTFGLYSIYWFYQTATELKAVARDDQASPGLWTVLLFIPFGSFFSMYKYGEVYEKASTEKLNRWITFLLFLFFPPAVWFLAQSHLNERAQATQTLARAA